MQRILIVDDEPNIVEGLHQLLLSKAPDELDICKAYSGREAAEWLESVPVDLVLSDIAMPGMSGLQLLSRIEALKLACRVVFLTGFDKFDYIHEGMKSPLCVGYILKTEGDATIVDIVFRELHAQRARQDNESLLARSEKQLALALPVLRMQYLKDLLAGNDPAWDFRSTDGDAFHYQVDLRFPIVPLLAWLPLSGESGYIRFAKQAILLDEILSSEISDQLRHEVVILEDSVVWLMQEPEPCEQENEAVPKPFPRHLRSLLQSVQNRFFSMTGIPISFAHSRAFISPSFLSDKVHSLQMLMRRIGGVLNRMMILDEDLFDELPDTGFDIPAFAKVDFAFRLNLLEQHLLHGRTESFEKAMEEIFHSEDGTLPPMDRYSQIAVISMFLSVTGKLGLSRDVMKDKGIDEMLLLEGAGNDLADKYIKLGIGMCDLYHARSERTEEASIERVKQHIHDHIGDKNLSLATLASVIHYNPSYLSRFFKQKTGQNLSEYINDIRLEKSELLLADPSIRISDVAYGVGFESSSYFAVFFKKRAGMTPNEYRTLRINPS